MAIVGGTSLKVAQEINMPDAVTAMNIFYFETDFAAPQTEQTLLDWLEPWVEALFTSVDGEMSDLVELGEFTLYAYSVLYDRWDNKGTAAPTVVGTEVGSMLPHGVCGMVRAYSTNPRSIARKYLAGFGDAQQSNGVWGAPTLAALAAFGVLWATSITVSAGNFMHPGVFDNTLKIVHRFTGTEVVLSEPAYQRRRRPGVGI